MSEWSAGIAFYGGLAAFVFGLIRVTTASMERRGRDALGVVALAAGGLLFVVAVIAFAHSPKGFLPI